jgi:O-antigen/teichoic acid export membrane protein
MFVGLQRRYRCLKWRWNLSKGKDWLAEAIPLGISDTVRGQGWQLDTVLLGLLQPAAVVGIYSAAYRPLTMLSWLPLAAAATTFPTLVRLAGSPPQFNRAVSNSIRLLWMSGLPLAVVICLGAEHVVTILAGRAYLEAAIPMRILVWRILLSSLTILYRFVFAAAGKLPTFARLVVLASALDAAVELLLIPTWGYLGACCGSLLGELVFAVGALLACRRVGIDGMDWRSLGCIGLAGSGMGALLWGAGGASLPRFVLVAAVSTALYFLSCLLLRALRWGELRRLYDALASWNEPAIEALEAVPEQEIGRVVGLEDLD